jgi:RNA polymerase sigma-70 factor (ECF subfamily)
MKTRGKNHIIEASLLRARTELSGESTTKAKRFWKHLEPLQGALESYCRHSIQDHNAVEDVLQNAVMAAFRDFDLFAEGTNFRAWIYHYLNLQIRAANRNMRAKPHLQLAEDPVVEDEWLLTFDEASFGALLRSPDELLQRCDDALAAAIRGLGEVERSTLLLKAVAGFKYREISEILQMPMGTVMSALSRARQRLRHELVEYGREHGLLAPEQSRREQ